MLNIGIEKIMFHKTDQDIQDVVEEIALHKNIHHIRIMDHSSIINYSSDVREIDKPLGIVDPFNIDLKLDTLKGRIVRTISESGTYCIIEPIKNQGQCRSCHTQPDVIAYLDADTKLTRAEINFFTGSKHLKYLLIAFVLVLVTGLYYTFNHFVTKPLLSFRNSLDAVEKGNYNIRLPESDDEIGVLHSHFNRMIREINESQRKIEEFHLAQLQHAGRLITVGELTAEMAHEINNYMGIIMTRADYLSYEAQSIESLSKYHDDLKVIIRQSEKISRITGNILRHSKKTPKSNESFNLVALLENSLQIFEPLIRKKNISVEKRYIDQSENIKGNSLHFEQIFTNLINNALDALDDGGTLKIEIKKKGTKTEISVIDNGQGINPEHISQIFSHFFTTKSEGKGTGLGLYIVKKLCEHNDCEIKCVSETGKGSQFILTLESGESNE